MQKIYPKVTDEWINRAIDKTVALIEKRMSDFRAQPAPPDPDEKYLDRKKRYDFLEAMLHYKDPLRPRKENAIRRIARGFLEEFIRQSENDLPPVNIEHGRNPEALEYWKQHPKEFVQAAAGGVLQTAAGYRKFQALRNNSRNRKVAWESVAEVIRASVDIFKEEYPKLETGHAVNASVYNEHVKIIGVAFGDRTITEQLTLR